MQEEEGLGFVAKSEKGDNDLDGERGAPATASSAREAEVKEIVVVTEAEKEAAPAAAPKKKTAKKRKR